MPSRALIIPASFIAAVLLVYVLAVGRDVLVPLVVAGFVWYLINALADGFRKFLPGGLSLALGVVSFAALIWIPIQLISRNLPQFAAAAPRYQRNLEQLWQANGDKLPFDIGYLRTELMEYLNLGTIATHTAQAFTSFAGSSLLVIIYVIFLLLEQGHFKEKLHQLFASDNADLDANGQVIKTNGVKRFFAPVIPGAFPVTRFVWQVVLEMESCFLAQSLIPEIGFVMPSFGLVAGGAGTENPGDPEAFQLVDIGLMLQYGCPPLSPVGNLRRRKPGRKTHLGQ